MYDRKETILFLRKVLDDKHKELIKNYQECKNKKKKSKIADELTESLSYQQRTIGF